MKRTAVLAGVLALTLGLAGAAYAGDYSGPGHTKVCHLEDANGNVLGLVDVDLDDNEGSEQSMADIELLPDRSNRRLVCA